MSAKHVLAALLVVLVLAGLTQAAPHLSIEDPVFDFGYAPQHSKITHVFWLRNTGDDTLRITKIVPG